MFALYSKITRRILPLLLVGYIVAYLDRVNVGFAKLQMLDDLGFSQTVYGFGAGIFFIGYFLLEVPSNLMLHRVGARRWISRIMISWGLLSAAMMFVKTPAQFYALRFLLGAAEAGFFPGIIFYLTLWFPTAHRARIIALFMTGVGISSITGSLLSGWIMESFQGINGWQGWQWMFVLEGLPAVIVGVIVWFRLEDDIARARWLSSEEKQQLRIELAQDAGSHPQKSFIDGIRDGRVWYACLIYFCIVTGLYGISFWLPSLISEMGVSSPARIGVFSAIPYAVATIGMIYMGRSSDRRGERRWHVAVSAALGAIGLALSVVLSAHFVAALAALTLATFGILSAAPLFWSIPTTYLRGAAGAAGIAIINSFGNLAGFVSPYLIGWVKDSTGATAAGVYVLAVSLQTASLLVLVGVPPTK